jgi:hypothetical protein
MQRYIVLYHAPVRLLERFAQATPEEAREGMALWVEWIERMGTSLVDPGKPLSNAVSVTKAGIAKSDSTVIGMSILQADSIDQAREMVRDHHHLDWAEDCEIVVLEEMPIPEMSADVNGT